MASRNRRADSARFSMGSRIFRPLLWALGLTAPYKLFTRADELVE
jgi:hypothetical protein